MGQEVIQPAERAARCVKLAGRVRDAFLDVLPFQDRLPVADAARPERPGRSRATRLPRSCASDRRLALCTGTSGVLSRASSCLRPKRQRAPKSRTGCARASFTFSSWSPTPLHADHGDEGPQHVVGPFADLVDAGVAHHALVGLVGEVAPGRRRSGIVSLTICHERLGGPDLEHGGFEHVVLGAAVDEGGALAGRRLHGEGVGGHVGDLLLDQLELGRAAA